MGDSAATVAAELETALEERVPSLSWTTEHYVGRTPVDVAGERDGGDGPLRSWNWSGVGPTPRTTP